MDMLTTTGLVTLVMVMVWRLHVVWAALFFVFFMTIELAFFTSTLLKVPHGGWYIHCTLCTLTWLSYLFPNTHHQPYAVHDTLTSLPSICCHFARFY